jgi:DNA-binding GntR family transcriptional regulator
MWSPRIDTNARVKYIGIVDAIEADIKNRLLKPGDRLPAQR